MPELVVLGSAQDGGVPHAGCNCGSCRRARDDYRQRRLPACIGVISGVATLMIDATSAFEEQWHRLWSRCPGSDPTTTLRFGAPGTILLTHAHTGHYVGLWQLDLSVLAAKGTRVVGPPKTIGLLASNEPWAAMVRDGYIRLEPLAFEEEVELLPNVHVRLTEVRHRSEWDTDTAAVWLRGPERSALYLPDIDFWREWNRDVADAVGSVDIALLDGCFWDRPTSPDVPHPPVRESLDLLQPVADARRTRIIFTHLNHSNPLVDAASAERREVVERGFEVAEDGEVYEV